MTRTTPGLRLGLKYPAASRLPIVHLALFRQTLKGPRMADAPPRSEKASNRTGQTHFDAQGDGAPRPFQGRCRRGQVPGASPPAIDFGAFGASKFEILSRFLNEATIRFRLDSY